MGSCCKTDWCGCKNCFDCHAYLKANKFQVPKDAPSAIAASGTTAWAGQLGWQSAKMPAWSAVPDASLQVGDSKLKSAEKDEKGLFATAPLPKGTVLPPFQGLMMTY